MATCKDCVHYEVCQMHYKQKCELTYESKREVEIAMGKAQKAVDIECDYYKDRARFVELPCKVGDDVYCIYHGKIERSGVTSICIGSHYTGIVIYTVQFSFTAENIGKFIFFSVEEAEQALKEREA